MTVKLIVEADGGSRGNPGVAGYGALVRDEKTGEVLATRAAPLGKESNNVAEYTGLIEGLRAVRDFCPDADVTVRMDSKLVVEQMSGRWKIKHDRMKVLAENAREVVADITDGGGSVRFEWIPREKNKAADKLSNDGMDGVHVERNDWGSVAQKTSLTTDELQKAVQEPAKVPEVAFNQKPSKQSATPGDTVRIILVRHAVTDFTTSGKLDGRGGSNPRLSDLGRQQAQAAARGVRELVGSAVDAENFHLVTSSLARAVETGAVIGDMLHLTPTVDDDWDEQSFGEWDGMSFADLRDEFGEDLRKLRVDPEFSPPRGESRSQLDARVANALKTAEAKGGTVIVVTHRIPIMSVLASALGLTCEAGWRIAAAPASLTGVEIARGHVRNIAFTNITAHLG